MFTYLRWHGTGKSQNPINKRLGQSRAKCPSYKYIWFHMSRLTVVKIKIGMVIVSQNTGFRYFVMIILVGHGNMVFIELSK